jgi:hypothetical protein
MKDDSLIIRQSDLDGAVHAGIIGQDTADKLIDYVVHGQASAHADDEQLRLVSGFNDIFVTIGLALFLGAIGYLSGGLMVLALPIAAWALAEIFTRKKRMALPSIVLLAVFATSSFYGAMFLIQSQGEFDALSLNGIDAWKFSVAGLITAALIGLHWLRFHVPITVAAGAAAVVMMLTSSLAIVFPNILNTNSGIVLMPMGLAIFATAMYLDSSDRTRRTRISDMAFWLHLLAAPLIVHPLVWNVANINSMGASDAAIIFALFAALSIVALVVDRRALLVSSLLYLGYALSTLLTKANWGSETFAIAVLGVGAIVLIMSIAWTPLRKILLEALPSTIRKFVPPIQTASTLLQKAN